MAIPGIAVLLATLAISPSASVAAPTVHTPARGKVVRNGTPTFAWTTPTGEWACNLQVGRDRPTQLPYLGDYDWPLEPLETVHWAQFPAGRWYWVVAARAEDPDNPGVSAACEYGPDATFSEIRRFVVPYRLRKVRARWRFKRLTQTVVFQVFYWTNDEDASVTIRARSGGRTYFEETKFGARAWSKNVKRFDWYFGDQFVCRKSIRVQAIVRAGPRRVVRVTRLEFTC